MYGVLIEGSAALPDRMAMRKDGQGQSARRLRPWFAADPDLFRTRFLPALTEETGGAVYVANSTRNLSSVFTRIVNDFKTRYLLTHTPAGVPATGWHPIEVKLKDARGDVSARRGYWR